MVTETNWRTLAEQIVFATPATDRDAKAILEWRAAREGKSLAQLVEELRHRVGAAEAS